MQKEPTSFQAVFDKWSWKEIRNCPGRFIFAEGVGKLTLNEIVGENLPVYEFETRMASDKVQVLEFGNDGGGLISFVKNDDKFLHTLNTEAGFARKLRQLEIFLPGCTETIR